MLVAMGALLCVATRTGGAEETVAADLLTQARERGVIEVAVYGDFPPFSFGRSAAEARGIDVGLARAIAQALGVTLKLRLIDAGESVSDDLRNHVWKGHYLGGGVADVMLHVGYDQAFARHESNILLFAPYFHETVVIGYRPGRIRHPESPLALTEHKVAVEANTISDLIMSSAYGGALRSATVHEQSLPEAVHALYVGEVDGVMGPRGELQGLLDELNVHDVLFYPQPPVGQMRTSWDVGIAVRRGAGDALAAAVQKAVQNLQTSGALAGMFTQYGVDYAAPTAAGPSY